MAVKEITDQEVLERFPNVLIDRDNVAHYRGLLQKKLLVNRCQDCGYWIYPERPICPECWSFNVRAEEVSGKGTVYMFTLLHQGPPIPGVDFSTPHPIAGIELPEREGLRYLSTIVNCPNQDIKIGMPVELTWIERAGVPAAAFQPAGKSAAKGR
jgi:hypothetical protein